MPNIKKEENEGLNMIATSKNYTDGTYAGSGMTTTTSTWWDDAAVESIDHYDLYVGYGFCLQYHVTSTASFDFDMSIIQQAILENRKRCQKVLGNFEPILGALILYYGKIIKRKNKDRIFKRRISLWLIAIMIFLFLII